MIIVPTKDWAGAAADVIEAELRRAIAARSVAHLALAGGGTPKPVYAALARRDLPWSAVEIWFGDERCVPPDHPDSNYAMAVPVLLDRIGASVHRMRGEDPDRQGAADAYAALLPERLDVVLLGMGADGHTASLFPGQDPPGRVAVVYGPKPPPWRLTLTHPVIEAARCAVVLVNGSGKAAMVARALYEPVDRLKLPIQIARSGRWILDEPAASLIPSQSVGHAGEE